MVVSEDIAHVGVQEAARMLGLSESTIWRYLRRGTLPSLRRGGRRLIPREALEAVALETTREEVPPLRSTHPIFRLIGAGRGGGNAPGARDKYGVLTSTDATE